MVADNDGKGRVTTAILGQKIDALAEAFDDARDETRRYREVAEKRIRFVEDACTRNIEEHKSLRLEQSSAVDGMRREGRIFSSIAGALAATAGAVTSWVAGKV